MPEIGQTISHYSLLTRSFFHPQRLCVGNHISCRSFVGRSSTRVPMMAFAIPFKSPASRVKAFEGSVQAVYSYRTLLK